jgi:flagellar biosynthesis protein FlhG
MEVRALAADADFLLIDAGSGLATAVATLAPLADQVVMVATPEPTAVADAHAVVRHLRSTAGTGATALRAVVNQARSAAEARDVLDRLAASSREFLGVVVAPLGHVRYDPRVATAVRARRPFSTMSPHTTAARCVRRLAETLVAERRPPSHGPGFFASLATRQGLRRVFARLE